MSRLRRRQRRSDVLGHRARSRRVISRRAMTVQLEGVVIVVLGMVVDRVALSMLGLAWVVTGVLISLAEGRASQDSESFPNPVPDLTAPGSDAEAALPLTGAWPGEPDQASGWPPPLSRILPLQTAEIRAPGERNNT